MITFTRDHLINGLSAIVAKMPACSEATELECYVDHLKAGDYDAAFSGPRFPDLIIGSFPPARIEVPPSIVIPPGYEIVIRKAGS